MLCNNVTYDSLTSQQRFCGRFHPRWSRLERDNRTLSAIRVRYTHYFGQSHPKRAESYSIDNCTHDFQRKRTSVNLNIRLALKGKKNNNILTEINPATKQSVSHLVSQHKHTLSLSLFSSRFFFFFYTFWKAFVAAMRRRLLLDSFRCTRCAVHFLFSLENENVYGVSASPIYLDALYDSMGQPLYQTKAAPYRSRMLNFNLLGFFSLANNQR